MKDNQKTILQVKGPTHYYDVDLRKITVKEFDQITELMKEDLIEKLHNELAPCSVAELLKAYFEAAGEEESSRILNGFTLKQFK